MLIVSAACVLLLSVLGDACICEFPRMFKGRVKVESSSKAEIYHYHHNFIADMGSSRVYTTPRQNTSDLSYKILDLNTKTVYERMVNGSCTVTHATGFLFPECVPSDYHRAGEVKEKTTEYQKWYPFFGRRGLPAGKYIVEYKGTICWPHYTVVVPSLHNPVRFSFVFKDVEDAVHSDTSVFSTSGC